MQPDQTEIWRVIWIRMKSIAMELCDTSLDKGTISGVSCGGSHAAEKQKQVDITESGD